MTIFKTVIRQRLATFRCRRFGVGSLWPPIRSQPFRGRANLLSHFGASRFDACRLVADNGVDEVMLQSSNYLDLFMNAMLKRFIFKCSNEQFRKLKVEAK